jgi:hypothetical protein
LLGVLRVVWVPISFFHLCRDVKIEFCDGHHDSEKWKNFKARDQKQNVRKILEYALFLVTLPFPLLPTLAAS